MTPTSVRPFLATALAMPKSRILATPSKETITFDGVTSRCTMPSGCAAPVGGAVRVLEPLGDVGDDAQRDRPAAPARRASRSASSDLLQVDAVHVLHGDEVVVVADLAEVEDLHDVRVREPRRDARLVEEHLHELLDRRPGGQDALDHALLLEAGRPALRAR